MARVLLRAACAGLVSVLVAGCDLGVGVLEPAGAPLRSGVYRYSAWSDFGGRGPTWWGHLDLRVDWEGFITGSYRLPDQCSDGLGYGVDCVGYVEGRVYRDGTFRFALDEGWLRNEGEVYSRYEAGGWWHTRLLGYRDRGDFELVRR